ncbi:MAG TPA: hypothetical protein VN317_07490 [Candidatus Methanoperedens sp.]|nr:hypothetical protein [Candidatus Methanoperedens sp.]
MTGAGERTRARRTVGWDLALVLLTAATLAAFGVLALWSMFHYKSHALRPDWSVPAFQEMMNRLASPLVVLLIVWLVLCIPKRLLSRRALLAYSAAVIAAGIGALSFGGVRFALGLVLGLSAVLQVVILGLVVAGVRLRFSGRGLALRAGSSLLHFGVVLFTLDLVALQGSPWHIPLFWVSTALLTAGCVLTFYVAKQR